MKKIILGFLLTFSMFSFGQVRYITFESKEGDAVYADLKNVTVHVIIKDFCDDSKPYKKILEENWKHSKLSFDYEEKFDLFNESNKGLCVDGEYYMYLERTMGSKRLAGQSINSNMQVNHMDTEICIAKAVGKKSFNMQYVVELPIYPAPGKDKFVGYPYIFVKQNVDVSKCFLNLSNGFYLTSTLKILDQFVEKKISYWKDYQKELSCESLKEVLATTLYVPQYVLLESSKFKDPLTYVGAGEYMAGYEGEYKIASNDEMTKKFKSGETFYYLLYSAGYGKWNFIVEGKTGKLISVSGESTGYNLDKGDMKGLYEHLKNNKTCK